TPSECVTHQCHDPTEIHRMNGLVLSLYFLCKVLLSCGGRGRPLTGDTYAETLSDSGTNPEAWSFKESPILPNKPPPLRSALR
ncbi:MAG TPA: hypothetical protein PLY87_28910, partial [Planctomycetaceae bacterium]|nr:hypothetical protein [Planctomycetaceae bacterium]